MRKLSDTMNIGLTFQMSLDSFLKEQHPIRAYNSSQHDMALRKLEEVKNCRSSQKKIMIAQEARKICIDCIESYIVEGIYSQSVYEGLDVLKVGMELAVMNLGKDFFLREISDFYDIHEAKSLLHIKFIYACTLFDAGYMKKARKQFKELLNLHPGDVYMAHHYLYVIYLYFEEMESFKALLHKYQKNSTMDVYVEFLYHVKSGNIQLAKDMIIRMKAINKYLYDLITYETLNTVCIHEMKCEGSEEEAGYTFKILKKVLHTMEYLHIFIVGTGL